MDQGREFGLNPPGLPVPAGGLSTAGRDLVARVVVGHESGRSASHLHVLGLDGRPLVGQTRIALDAAFNSLIQEGLRLGQLVTLLPKPARLPPILWRSPAKAPSIDQCLVENLLNRWVEIKKLWKRRILRGIP